MVPGDLEARLSLQINEGFPVVSYYDPANGDLKLASCVSACASAAPSWAITTVDRVGDAGRWNSLVLNGGRASLVYFASIRSCSGVNTSCHEAFHLTDC